MPFIPSPLSTFDIVFLLCPCVIRLRTAWVEGAQRRRVAAVLTTITRTVRTIQAISSDEDEVFDVEAV